jgi:phosphonate transport system substrate-binding protein
MTQNVTLAGRLRRRHAGRSLIPTILLTVAAVAIGAGAMYVITVRNPVIETEEQTRARFMTMTGLDRPVHNRLAERFRDLDSDSVADTPTNPAEQVDPPKLLFCYVAQEDPTEYEKLWRPFTDHLSKVTGRPVEYLPLHSSDDQLKALRDGKLHVAGFNTGSVPMAVNACGFVPVARVPTGDASGTHVEIIVPAGSPIQAVEDFKNMRYTIAFVEPNSNSGYKAPIVLLRDDKGIQPERDYLFRTTGSHEASISGIAKKQYDAAAVSTDMLGREESKGNISKNDYRSIFKSESFPTAALGYAYNLKPELAAKVREAILTFDIKGTSLEAELSPATQSKFIPVNYKNDWSLIRRIDDASGQTHILEDTESSPTTAPATRPAKSEG